MRLALTSTARTSTALTSTARTPTALTSRASASSASTDSTSTARTPTDSTSPPYPEVDSIKGNPQSKEPPTLLGLYPLEWVQMALNVVTYTTIVPATFLYVLGKEAVKDALASTKSIADKLMSTWKKD